MGFPLVVGASSSVSGWSRARYRPRLQGEIGYFGQGRVSSLLSGLEARRYVCSSDFQSDTVAPSTYDGLFLYVTQGDQAGSQRKLVDGTFDGPNALFALDAPFDDELEEGDRFEISELPAADYQGLLGANTALDRALDTLPLIDIVSVDAVTDRVEYSLANYSWPVLGIRDVFAPRASTADARRAVRGFRFVNDAESPVLRLPWAYATGETFEVELLRPASSWIRQDGTWGEATGLTSDGDEALYGVEAVVRAAKPFALEYLAKRFRRGAPERADLLRDAGDARAVAAVGRWFGSYRGDGRQRIGAVGRR